MNDDELPNPYDQIVYPTRPRPGTHADPLAVAANLVGLSPTALNKCRVLELGCGTGGNLTPMAATLPGSQFVGVDLSAVQIEMAKKLAAELGLTNTEFHTASITDIGDSLGSFDYVICHGVYSWVPPAVAWGLLELCGQLLTPHGVAMISYNTYPGWYRRAAARDAMCFHGKRAESPEHQTRAARAFLYFLAKNVADPEEPYAKLLRDEAELLAGESDYYLYHEHLESDNRPVYFRDFMAEATDAGLQYVGEVPPHRLLTGLPKEVQESVRQMSPDLIHLEQYCDFLRNRSFRRTILCRADATLDRSPKPAVLNRFQVSAVLHPKLADPDVVSEAEVEFESPGGTSMSTNAPVIKAALTELHRASPRPVPVTELAATVEARLGPVWAADPAKSQLTLAQTLLDFYVTGLVGVHTHAPTFVTTPSERPVGFGPARLAAATQDRVPTVLHSEIAVPAFDRLVLRQLDGTRDRSAVVAAVASEVPAGESADEKVAASIAQLARSALLVA